MSVSSPTNHAAEAVTRQYVLCSYAVEITRSLRDLRQIRQGSARQDAALDKAIGRLRRVLASVRREIREIDDQFSDPRPVGLASA